MSQIVPDYYTRFLQSVDVWIGICKSYSRENLLKKPAPDAWSLGQLINHIILDTSFHIGQMKLALIDQENGLMDMAPAGIEMLAADSFPDLRMEGHPDNAYIPQPDDVDELVGALLGIKKEVEILYTTFSFINSSGKSQHPGLGFFTAKEWLQFTEMHMRHHLRQKNRIDEYLRLNP